MNELTEKEINLISKDIDQQGLTYIQLKNEILDHVCCQIEQEMDKGLMFNQAYRKVREEMGKKRIREIQHETLSLINKKYRRMKRTMYFMGVAAPILIVAGMTFKIMHWPGASVLLTLALFVLGLIFLPLFVMDRIRDTRKQNEPVPLGLYISGMLSGLFAVIGALLKIQHWPGAGVLLTLGLAGLALVVLPIYASQKIKESKVEDVPVNKRILIGGVLTGILFILGALFKIMHWPGAGYVLIVSWSMVAVILLPYLVLSQLKKKDKQVNNFLLIILIAVAVSILTLAYIRSSPVSLIRGNYVAEITATLNTEYFEDLVESKLTHLDQIPIPEQKSSLVSLAAEADELCAYIHSVKDEAVIHLAEEENPEYDDADVIDLREEHYLTRDNEVYKILSSRDSYRLYTMIKGYRDHALKLSESDELSEFISVQLALKTPEGDASPEDWVSWHFPGPAIRAVSELSIIESSVRLVENELLGAYLK